MMEPDDDYIPDLCLYWWQEGVKTRKHVCTVRDYPFHVHKCGCCGMLLTNTLGQRLKELKGAEV